MSKEEKKTSQVLAEKGQLIQKERRELEADLDRIRKQIEKLDQELEIVLTDVVACL